MLPISYAVWTYFYNQNPFTNPNGFATIFTKMHRSVYGSPLYKKYYNLMRFIKTFHGGKVSIP
jgi:hypothetical protein